MRNRTILATPLLLLLVGCSLFKSKPPAPPPHPFQLGATATLGITTGIPVIASTELPRGFIPNAAVPPMWLAEDLGIAIAGSLNGRGAVLGLSGPKLSKLRVITGGHRSGTSAGSAGIIQAVAASPDGMELALAVAEPANNRLNLVLIDSIGNGESHSVASFDGAYDVVSMNWIDRDTLAFLIYPSAPPAQIAANVDTVGAQSGGLYVIGITGLGSITHLDRITCRRGPSSFSPNRRFAASAGEVGSAPAVVDLQNQTCAQIRVASPVKLLGWAPDSSGFLYAAANDRGTCSTARYTVAVRRSTLVAAFIEVGGDRQRRHHVAIGDRRLSWKAHRAGPNRPVKTEVALMNPASGEIKINSLGYATPPALFAKARSPSRPRPTCRTRRFVPTRRSSRELIEYLIRARSAFVSLGSGRGPLSMSWSPNGLITGARRWRSSRVILRLSSRRAESRRDREPGHSCARGPITPVVVGDANRRRRRSKLSNTTSPRSRASCFARATTVST